MVLLAIVLGIVLFNSLVLPSTRFGTACSPWPFVLASAISILGLVVFLRVFARLAFAYDFGAFCKEEMKAGTN